jgi:hypothetical protein
LRGFDGGVLKKKKKEKKKKRKIKAISCFSPIGAG